MTTTYQGQTCMVYCNKQYILCTSEQKEGEKKITVVSPTKNTARSNSKKMSASNNILTQEDTREKMCKTNILSTQYARNISTTAHEINDQPYTV